jgi:hypothetical protein
MDITSIEALRSNRKCLVNVGSVGQPRSGCSSGSKLVLLKPNAPPALAIHTRVLAFVFFTLVG